MRVVWLGMVLIIGAMALVLLSAIIAKSEIEAFSRAQQYLNLWVHLLTFPSITLGVVLIGAGLAWFAVTSLIRRDPDV